MESKPLPVALITAIVFAAVFASGHIPSAIVHPESARLEAPALHPHNNRCASSFERAVSFTLPHEGDGSDEGDGAGLTRFGISQRHNPDIDVRNLTKEKAIVVYRERYWDSLDLDSYEPAVAVAAFDTAVNVGQYKTMSIVRNSPEWRDILDERINHYISVSARNTSMRKYMWGWIVRTVELRNLCERMEGEYEPTR